MGNLTEKQTVAYHRGVERMTDAIEKKKAAGALTDGWLITNRTIEVSCQWNEQDAAVYYERAGAIAAIDEYLR